MKPTSALLLFVLGVRAALAHADDKFHVYAPSRTTGKLLIVEATPSDDGLSLKSSRQVELGFPAATITAHPNKPLLYVAAAKGDEDKTPGALITLDHKGGYVKHAPLTFSHGYSYLSLDRASRFLLGANYFGGFVDVYVLDAAGTPGKRVAALNEGRRNAHCVLPSPDNRFVYIPYVKDRNAIFQYGFNPETGQLTALDEKNANPPEGTGPRHMVYHPNKPIVYFSNEQHLGISAYDMEKSGPLKLRQVCDAVSKDELKQGVSSSDIAITRDGRFLFAGIRGHQRDFDWISRYRVKANGDVELLGLTPADKIPWGLALSPCGRYLMVTAFQGATLTAFAVSDDGNLTRVASLNWDKNISDLVTVPRRELVAPPPVPFNLKERFGEQRFAPRGGFILSLGQKLPNLVWDRPDLVAKVVDDPTIPTRWFNERFDQVETADKPGRYYAYGEAPVPTGPMLRRAMTCCCVEDDVNLEALAEKRVASTQRGASSDSRHEEIAATVRRWRTSEEGAVELAALLEADQQVGPVRKGQWQMENATRHVRLKRKLMGLDGKPVVKATVKPLQGEPAPVLRNAPLEQAGITEVRVRQIETKLDEWYASSLEPMAVVIARNGVIVLAKGYGTLDGQKVTVDTPMLLHSAMKPLIGLQLAMYVDRGILRLDEPIGNYLPDFDSPRDRKLTFRAGHVHVTGIHFPWELAFSRLFYFHTWHESLIAHCKREWAPGDKHRYGVVGIILSVRALELLRGRNYWDAMERDLFEPLGIRNVLPGGVGFSAESLARIGVLLDNRGKYGNGEVISEETHQAILPTSLKPYFPDVDMEYGIGLKDESQHLGPGSYGHGGGCGTLLAVNPEKHLVFAMVRNGQGKDFKKYRSEVTALLREWIKE